MSPWSKQAVLWALDEGIIVGRSETMLVPHATATRGEVAVIMSKMLEA